MDIKSIRIGALLMQTERQISMGIEKNGWSITLREALETRGGKGLKKFPGAKRGNPRGLPEIR